MKTKFIKVPTAERLPEKTDYYFTEEGLSYFIKGVNEWSINKEILEWFEEVEDREDEMREMLEEAKEKFMDIDWTRYDCQEIYNKIEQLLTN